MGGKENGGINRSPPPSKEGPSLLNIILLYLSLLGLGVIAGYGGFFFMFNDRCVNLLRETEVRYNASQVEWQTKLQEALSEKDQCISPLHELQGKLEAQSIFAEKHQALLQKHEETLSKLAALQQSKEEYSESQGKLQARIGELQLELERSYQKLADSMKQKELAEQELQTRLSQAEEKLAQQTRQVNSMKNNGEHCASKLPELESNLKTIKSFVQNRAERMCRME